MSRNIIMCLPALAFVLPMVSVSPALAGGFSKQTQEQGYVPGKQQGQGQGQGPGYEQTEEQGPGYEQTEEQGGGEGGYVSVELALEFCTMVQVVAENRGCELIDTEQNIARCGLRYLPGKEQQYKPTKPGKGGEQDEGGNLIFVKLEQCTALGVNIDVKG